MRPINRIIVHHSATDQGSAESFRRHHIDVNGWSDIGYHYVIRADTGAVEPGRPLARSGAHARHWNGDSIGICLVGNFEEYPPTDAQLVALMGLLRRLTAQLRILPSQVIGHMDVNETDCPGKYLYSLLPLIRMALTVPVKSCQST